MTSKFKAFDKRTKTLLVEYKNQFKTNKFTDKRIGENDSTLSLEDKMFKRFVVERQKNRDRKAKKFNLNDGDDDDDNEENGFNNQVELTHFGQSLSQIENFEKVQLSDDDEDVDDPNDVDKGKISAKIVSENFFGGFTDKNKNGENDDVTKKNRKQWVDEMILKSKQIKYERQKERDKTLDLTEQLDKEWRNVLPLISTMAKKTRQEQEEQERQDMMNKDKNKKPDDFDVLVRSLQFDSKAKPTDKLKLPEEIEKERLEALKKNEKDLIERMNKEVEEEEESATNRKGKVKSSKNSLRKIPANHFSVDDMEFDDPEYLQMRNREDIISKQKKEKEEEEKNAKKIEDVKLDEQEEEEERDAFDKARDSEKDSDDDDDDDDDDDENEEEADKVSSNGSSVIDDKFVGEKFDAICLELNSKQINLEKFDKQVKALIESLDPSRDEKNKQRLCLLTGLFIEYYQSLFNFKPSAIDKAHVDVKLVQLLTSHIYNLTFKYGNKSTKKEPSIYVEMFKKMLKRINAEYVAAKITEKKFPNLSTLFLFKLVLNIFPASDFRHQIMTPCLLIMTRYLTQSSVQTVAECFRGSFLCNLCFEFINKSKRYIPECIQYLNGILYLSIDWSHKNEKVLLNSYELSTIYETFKITKLKLVPTSKVSYLSSATLEELSLVKTSLMETQSLGDSKIVSIIGYNLDLLKSFVNCYEQLATFKEVFHLTSLLLNLLPVESYPKKLTSKIEALQEAIIDGSEKPLEYLKCMSKKPLPSKLFEPKIVAKSKYDPRHHNSIISEKQLLRRKHKKELKSAIKELRQDNKFLARVQLDEQLEKDAKRAQKVKEIMGSLGAQEGDYQRAKRLKS